MPTTPYCRSLVVELRRCVEYFVNFIQEPCQAETNQTKVIAPSYHASQAFVPSFVPSFLPSFFLSCLPLPSFLSSFIFSAAALISVHIQLEWLYSRNIRIIPVWIAHENIRCVVQLSCETSNPPTFMLRSPASLEAPSGWPYKNTGKIAPAFIL